MPDMEMVVPERSTGILLFWNFGWANPKRGAIYILTREKHLLVATDAEASDIRLVDMAGREQAMTWAPAGDGLYQIRAEGWPQVCTWWSSPARTAYKQAAGLFQEDKRLTLV